MSQGNTPSFQVDHSVAGRSSAPQRQQILFQGMNPYAEIHISRHHLPHWTQPGGTYFVTFRLADSIPAVLRAQWLEERALWLQWHPEPWSPEVDAEYQERFTKRQERWLDAGMGQCYLRQPEVRAQVERHLSHGDADRYDLDAYVLMPNHVHALLIPRAGQILFDLLKGIKGTSARTCNRMLDRTGQPFWMDDNYTRIVRSARELDALRRYIADNPVKARLRPDEYTLVLKNVLYVE